jgi:hypothetical protein
MASRPRSGLTIWIAAVNRCATQKLKKLSASMNTPPKQSLGGGIFQSSPSRSRALLISSEDIADLLAGFQIGGHFRRFRSCI